MKTKLDRDLFSSLIPDISTAVPVDNEWVLTFSELVSAGLGNTVINNSGDGSVFLQIDVNLNFNTVDDFNTVDTIAPTLTSSAPADDATAVLVDSNVVLTFDEAVVAGTGNIIISDGNDSRIIPVDDDQVSIIDNIVTINPTEDLQSDTTYNVQLESGVINDVAGNAYAGISNVFTLNFVTTDTIAPLAPALALAADTGSDPNDHITSDSTVNVSGLEGGATWEYSADRGDNWIAGNAGNSFELRTGIYSTGQVLVRQIDRAGHVSDAGSFGHAVIIDATAQAPTLALAADTGSDPNDHITSDSTVNVSGLERGAAWEYSSDRGGTWTAGSAGKSFELSGEGYIAGQILVRQTDVAGNVSDDGTFADTVIIDTTAPTVAIADAGYDASSNTLTFTGTNMNTLLSGVETAASDIKTNLDWSELHWDIDSGNINNIIFTESEITSAKVSNDATLHVILDDTKAATLEEIASFDPQSVSDSVAVSGDFFRDMAGNVSDVGNFVGPGRPADPAIVVFDLVSGVSSSHSDRSFDASTTYTIYIRVDSDSFALNTNEEAGQGTFGRWTNAENLGRDDRIVLVGNEEQFDVKGSLHGEVDTKEFHVKDHSVRWEGDRITLVDRRNTLVAALFESGPLLRSNYFNRTRVTVDLWTGTGLPSAQSTISAAYQRTMKDFILLTQGLL